MSVAGVAPQVPRALAGRYRLVRLLARGGMAEVWEGRDEVLGRPVAVKVLLSHLATDPFLRERFRREAITAARLVHPGIVAIFDAGVELLGENGTAAGTLLAGSWARDERERLESEWPEQPSTAFIIMELVPGETLRDLIAHSGPLAPELAVAIISQVTDALAYAHAQGLVHRDIKPANVLLGTEGQDLVRVKVADFGIAKAAATAHLDLTASGTLLGTPKYLAPEQVQGNEPDARADLYSLGVVLYEMLCGQAPFKGSTEMATALAHVQQEAPALQKLRPGLPPSLYELVSALLVKDPAQRVPSALVLGGALTSVRRQLGLPAGDTGSYIKLSVPRHNSVTTPETAPSASAGRAGALAPPTVVAASGATGPEPVVMRATPSGGVPATGQSGLASTVALGTATEVALKASPGPAGTEAPPKKGAQKARPRHRTGRSASIVVATLLVTGLVVFWALVKDGGKGAAGTNPPGVSQSTGGATSNAPLSIVSVHELTQNTIRPNDNLSTLPDVITGRGKVWTSDVYVSAHFGNSGGFGLVLQLSGTHTLHDLEVQTPMSGWAAQVYVSTSGVRPGCTGGSAAGCYKPVTQWGPVLSSGTDLNGDHTFSLGGRQGSWVLFWMLDPGPDRQAVVQKLTVS